MYLNPIDVSGGQPLLPSRLGYDLGVVVPARRGSSRIREKSLLPFGDQDSLIEWKLSQLVRVIEPKRVYLSSEDAAFLKLGERFGVSLHARDPHLAKDHDAPFRDVITGIVRDVPHAHIAWCTVVCPLMSPAEYAASFHRYRDEVLDGPHDSLVGVNRLQEYFWCGGAALNYRATRDHTISQQLPVYHRVTNSIYMAPRAEMLRREYFLADNPYMAELSRLAGVDIDYIEDYRHARALYTIYAEDGLDHIDIPELQAEK